MEDTSNSGHADTIIGLREWVNAHPQDAEAIHRLAVLLHASGQLEEALGFYEQTLKLVSGRDAAEAWSDAGRVYEQLGDTGEAERCFGQAASTDPDNPVWHHNLGVAHACAGREHDAFEQFRRALECDPGFVEALLEIGNLLVGRGEVNLAKRAYSEAVSRAPHNAVAISNLGHLHLLEGMTAEAVCLLERAVEVNPQYANGRVNLGNAYLEAERIEDAIRQFRMAISLDASNHVAAYNLGLALLKQGDQNGALNSFRKSVEISSSFATGHKALAALAAEMGRRAEAVRAHKLFLEYAAPQDQDRQAAIDYIEEND